MLKKCSNHIWGVPPAQTMDQRGRFTVLMKDNDISENPFTMIEISPHWLPAIRDGLHLIHPNMVIYGTWFLVAQLLDVPMMRLICIPQVLCRRITY